MQTHAIELLCLRYGKLYEILAEHFLLHLEVFVCNSHLITSNFFYVQQIDLDKTLLKG